MANFIVECPACKKPLQAGTGLFSKKKIKCSCGYLLDVSAERFTQEACPHCGNNVVYDRSKSNSAICPVCKNKIKSSGAEMVRLTCPACKIELTADKSAKTFTCPQCKTLIDVQARIMQEKSSGQTSVIKWDMGVNDVFVYRHPIENFNIGSQLIVSESQKALFFRNGKGLDVFGPGRHILETQKLPLLEELFKFPTDAELTFDSKVYFIRTNRLPVKWGVPEIRLRNPEMDFYIEIGISGSMDVEVIDDNESVRKFVYMVLGATSGTESSAPMGAGESYTSTYIADKFRDVVTTRLSDLMANIIIENKINVLDIERNKIVISEILRKDFNKIFEEYGLVIPTNHFNLTTIKIHNNEAVERWRKQEAERNIGTREEKLHEDIIRSSQGRIRAEEENYAIRGILHTQAEGEMTKVGTQAESEALIIRSKAEGISAQEKATGESEAIKLKGTAEAEAYSAQAQAEAAEMRAKGYTYAQETQRQIGLEAMQNGLPGTGTGGKNGSSSGSVGGALGNVMGLGIELGTMASVMNMAKDMMSPVLDNSVDLGKGIVGGKNGATSETWNCKCGKTGITSGFCPDCGTKKPEEIKQPTGWNCKCGCKNITSRFCPDCGSPRPVISDEWDCPKCGCKGIKSKFCPDCGNKKGE